MKARVAVQKSSRRIFRVVVALTGLLAGATFSGHAADYYWDTDGATPGFGTSPRDGTWGVDAFWSSSTSGNVTTVAWPGLVRPSAPDTARFQGGSGTITVSGTQTSAAIRVHNSGNYTFTGGTLNLETSNFGTGLNASSFDGDNGNSMTVDSAITLGADGGTGTREIIFSIGRTAGTAGTNTLTLNGSISAGAGARATTQLIQLRPQTASALGSATITQTANSVISNGSQTVSMEFGTRAADANSGRIEVKGTNTYTGSTRIGSGTTVVYTNVANNSPGAFGNNTNAIDIGFGQLVSTSHARLLTNGARTISKAINVGNGASSTSDYAITLGGETADISSFSGNIDLDGTVARTTKVSLTAAAGGNVTFSGVLSHGTGGSSVPIEKIGEGIVRLSGNNTYTGGTTVSAGTLLVNNSAGSGTGSGAVVVAGGATLGGTGTISGVVTVTGVVAPGDGGIGSLKVGNTVTWNAGGNWVFDLGAANASDFLDITGDFAKGSGSGFVFDFAGASATGTFTLVGWSGATGFSGGDFGYVNLGGDNTGSFAIVGNQLQFTAVPEPSVVALVALAFGFTLLSRRRRA